MPPFFLLALWVRQDKNHSLGQPPGMPNRWTHVPHFLYFLRKNWVLVVFLFVVFHCVGEKAIMVEKMWWTPVRFSVALHGFCVPGWSSITWFLELLQRPFLLQERRPGLSFPPTCCCYSPPSPPSGPPYIQLLTPVIVGIFYMVFYHACTDNHKFVTTGGFITKVLYF